MRPHEGHMDVPALVLTLTVLLLMGLPALAPSATADPITIDTFKGGHATVELDFRDEATNSTAAIVLPKGCTVTSAKLDIEGVRRRGDDPRSLDLSNWDVASSSHRAWRGWVQGNYPPAYPFWNPYSPKGTAFLDGDYDDVGNSDDARLGTSTGTQTSSRYPFHLFMFTLPDGDLHGLKVEWEGNGYCSANSSTRGAEMFVWRNDTRGWVKAAWYSKTEVAQDRVLENNWTSNPERFVDDDRQVFMLVYGKRSENTAPPNPSTEEGVVNTDYVRVNVTLAGAWEGVDDAILSVYPRGEVWTIEGALDGPVTVGVSGHLLMGLQEAVDKAPLEPGAVTIPLEVNVSTRTAAVVRLSNLSVTYDPIVNQAPGWGAIPSLEMDEDVDAHKLLDLSEVTTDDHSADRLTFTVVSSSTEAIQAVVEEGHFLSFVVREDHWYGTATFTINATDPWGVSATSPSIPIVVREVNDPPSVLEPGRQFGRQGAVFYYPVEAHDVDGDALEYLLDTDVFDIDIATGEINFTPTNDQVGLHQVNISVADGRGGVTRVEMALDVENVNDPPTLHDPGPLSGMQGSSFSHIFVVEDIDLAYGDILTWEILGTEFYRNVLQLNPITGELAWLNLGNSEVGVHNFSVQVTDSKGARDRVHLVLTIGNVNDPPVFAHIENQTVPEEGHLSYNVHVSDPDLSVDPDEELTWTVEPPLFEISQDGTFSFDPGHEHLGDHVVQLTVTDSGGLSHHQTFSLTVRAVNHPPVIEDIPDQMAYEDSEFVLWINISDPDEGGVVVVTSRGAPFMIPTDGGEVRWMPEERHGGEHLVTIEAKDQEGLTAKISFELLVVTFNDPPTAVIHSPNEGTTFAHDEEVLLSVLAQDEEGEHLIIVWKWRYDDSPQSQWDDINTGHTVYWIEPPDGRIRVRVEVSDGANVTVDETVFEVEETPDEGGGATGIIVGAILALAVIVLLLVLILRRGKTKPAVVEEGEEVWEEMPDDAGTPPLHKGRASSVFE